MFQTLTIIILIILLGVAIGVIVKLVNKVARLDRIIESQQITIQFWEDVERT